LLKIADLLLGGLKPEPFIVQLNLVAPLQILILPLFLLEVFMALPERSEFGCLSVRFHCCGSFPAPDIALIAVSVPFAKISEDRRCHTKAEEDPDEDV
jgi:hypothetical protein